MNRIILAAFLLIPLSASASNSVVNQVAACKSIEASNERLACFDAISVSTPKLNPIDTPVVKDTGKQITTVKEIKETLKKQPESKQKVQVAEKNPKVEKSSTVKQQEFGLKQERNEPEFITLEVTKVKKNPYGKLTVYLEQEQAWKDPLWGFF